MAITNVQSKNLASSSSISTTSNVTKGNIVVVYAYSASATTPSCANSGTCSVTFTLKKSSSYNGQPAAIFSGIVTASGSCTATISGMTTVHNSIIAELSGCGDLVSPGVEQDLASGTSVSNGPLSGFALGILTFMTVYNQGGATYTSSSGATAQTGDSAFTRFFANLTATPSYTETGTLGANAFGTPIFTLGFSSVSSGVPNSLSLLGVGT